MFKALNRIKWRFTGKSNFKPNEEDIKALNEVIRWINQQKEKTINNNKLFAKLFITFYNDVLTTNETTILDDLAQKQVSRLLALNLNQFYIAFHKQLHTNIRVSIMEGVDAKDLSEEDVKKAFEEKYSLFEVEARLNDMVTEAINKFSNYD